MDLAEILDAADRAASAAVSEPLRGLDPEALADLYREVLPGAQVTIDGYRMLIRMPMPKLRTIPATIRFVNFAEP